MQSFKECSNAHTRIQRERVDFGGGSRKRPSVYSIAALVLGLASQSLFAQSNCIGQSQPLRPASVVPISPMCVCVQTNSCHWAWIEDRLQTQPTIPIQQWNQPKVTSPSILDLATQAEELKLLRLQNQALENNTNGVPQATPSAIDFDALALQAEQQAISGARTNDAKNTSMPTTTYNMVNGWFWEGLSITERITFLSGVSETLKYFHRDEIPRLFSSRIPNGAFVLVIDGFYADHANLPVPVMESMMAMAAKVNGVDPSALEALISKLRSDATDSIRNTGAK